MVVIWISGCVFAGLVLVLIKFLHEVWWNPNRIESILRAQDIKGPGYKFICGNTKDIVNLKNEATAAAMEISDHQLQRRTHPHFYLWRKQYGKNFVFWIGSKPQLIVTDTRLAKEILYDNDLYPKPDFGSYAKRLFGDGLVAAKGDKWTTQRKLANHAFHGDNLKRMIPAIIESLEVMLEKWREKEGKEIEVFEEFKQLTSEIISRTAFSSSYLEGQRTFDMLEKLNSILYKNVYKVTIPLVKNLIKTEDEFEAEKLEEEMKECIMKMIKKREDEAKIGGENHNYGNDFLGVLLKSNKEGDDKGKKVSVQDIIDDCKTFYVAGHETTSSALTWTMFLLSTHTDWQHKARNEVLHLFGTTTPNFTEFPKLKTLNMIVNEAMRLYPSVTNLVREVRKGSKLGKLKAPSRMDIIVPMSFMHHDPEVWGEDVELFKPERFSEGVAKATKNNIAAFVPFGLGPRSCVGMNFAMTEIKLALTMILQRYSFSLSPNYVHSPIALPLIRPQNGLQILLKPF